MKKIFVFLLAPFILNAQQPLEDKNKSIQNVPAEISSTEGQNNSDDPRSLIESYRQRVIKGESISDLAKLYSQDPGSASGGGLYQNITRGTMVTEFEEAAFSLQVGEISPVFATDYGFHFIQLISRRGDTLDLRHILIKK